jgi:hypothetical protein
MPVPQKVDVQHYRGDTLGLMLRVWEDPEKTQPANFDNATITAQVRTATEATEVAADFEVEVSGNTLTLTLPPKLTRDLGPTNVFDVEVDWESDDSSVQTVIAGALAIASDVTRVPTV